MCESMDALMPRGVYLGEWFNGSMVHPVGGNFWFNGSMDPMGGNYWFNGSPYGGNYWFNGSMVYLPMFRNSPDVSKHILTIPYPHKPGGSMTCRFPYRKRKLNRLIELSIISYITLKSKWA